MIKIKKKNGQIEPLDIKKIHKFTKEAVENIDGVSQSELELDSKLQFRDMMTTSEIQDTIIRTAADKIDVDSPNWTFVAARLFLFEIYHKTNGNNEYGHLKNYFLRAEKLNKITKGFKDLYDLEELNSYIKIDRDYQFTFLGIKTLYDRYLLKDEYGNPIELPQHLFMSVSMFLAQKEKEPQYWAKKFYDILSKFEVMAATPTLSNCRTLKNQASSCYITSIPDTIEGIFDAYKEMSLLSKFGGGIGSDFSQVRASGSSINGNKKIAGGIVPFLKITNDIAIAVDQLGVRRGSIAVYLEPWHLDIRNFIELKKNSGEERRRTHDLFTALWINDIFMERVASEEKWTLFDPYETKELTNLYGEDFEKKYLECENNEDLLREEINAKTLWKEILKSYFETGSPFLGFKDNANRANPNNHRGIIRSSNLCTEIFQNTEPNHYKIKIIYENKTTDIFEEEDIVTLDNGNEKEAKKITNLDVLNNKNIYLIEKEVIEGDTAVCNLASINLSKINTKDDLERVIPIAIRMLDNVIDINFYPVSKAKKTNLKTRSIGLGVMGEAELLATSEIDWGSKEHYHKIDEIMETVSFNVIQTSNNLSKEKGSYEIFEGSNWSKGIFPIDLANKKALNLTNRDRIYDWEDLRNKVKSTGMRNGYLMAIAPTSSISILTGTTQTIEPVYKNKWFEENMSGLITVTAPKLSSKTFKYYKSVYNIDQIKLIEAGAIRQKWIDQGQSLNIFIALDKASGKYLNNIYMTAWKLGLKSTYYLRSQSPDFFNSEYVKDRTIECVGCQ